ncbi:hypothetical protein GCM10027448_20730 [Nocardioides dilutus]
MTEPDRELKLTGFRRVPRSIQQQYDPSMSDGKVRKTLTLDPDIVEVLGSDPAALSATVNALLREEVERRKRRASLKELVEELEADYGPADPDEVERIRALMQEAEAEIAGA